MPKVVNLFLYSMSFFENAERKKSYKEITLFQRKPEEREEARKEKKEEERKHRLPKTKM